MVSMLLVTLLERLSQPNVIIGIVLAVIGLAAAILARRIACVARKQAQVSDNDSIYLAVKIIGLIFIVVALIVMVIR